MTASTPFVHPPLFHIGWMPVTEPVATTWGLMAALAVIGYLSTRSPGDRPGRWRIVLETVVTVAESQIRDIMQRDPGPFLPLLATLFLFVATANLTSLVPGLQAPTAAIETPAALAIVVFVAVHFYGIRTRGLGPYLRGYLKPSPVMLPLNILSEITRTFSLMIRLFGNMMSHEFVIGIVVTLAGVLVPIPFMALTILIGLIQAYIFTILAAVFIAAGVGATEKP